MNKEQLVEFTRRALIAVGILTVIVLILFLAWQTINVLLLVFAGILFAVFLNGISRWISEHSFLSYKPSLILVVLGLLLMLGIGGAIVAPSLFQQADALSESLVSSLQSLRDSLSQTQWGQAALEQTPTINEVIASPQSLITNIINVFSSTVNILTGLVVVLFTGLYFAYEPDLYLNGLVKLVPRGRRSRAREVLAALGHMLRHWLIGRFVGMAAVGVMAAVGFSLIGLPLGLILGVLAGLLDFVPFIGPLLAIVPAMLLALTDGPQQVLYVFLIFQVIQFIEGYFLTPFVERKAVSLPFAATIVAQVFFGVLAGPLGVALASPLAAVMMVVVKMLYVEDVLGDHAVKLPDESGKLVDKTKQDGATGEPALRQPPPAPTHVSGSTSKSRPPREAV